MSVSQAFCGAGSVVAYASIAQPNVFTPVAESVTIKLTGGKRDQAEVTNMDSTSGYKEFIAALKDAGELQVDGNFIPADAGQQGVSALFESGAVVNWQFTLPNQHGYFAAAGFVIDDRGVSAPVDKKVTTSFKVRFSGPRTYHPFGS